MELLIFAYCGLWYEGGRELGRACAAAGVVDNGAAHAVVGYDGGKG